jgi:nitrous oxidase accessory protein
MPAATLRIRSLPVLVSGLTALSLAAAAGGADTHIVNPADPAAFAGIQAAVDAAAPGDVIIVHSGTYAPVTITKNNLFIKAQPGAAAVVDATGQEVGIHVMADGVTLMGLTAINAGVGLPSYTWDIGFNFLVTGNNNTVRNSTATGGNYGFMFWSCDGCSALNNTATLNLEGMELLLSTGNRITGNVLTNNTLFGLALVTAHHNHIANNDCSNNEFVGLLVTTLNLDPTGSDNNEIIGNTCNNNAVWGIAMLYGDGNRFSGNTSDSNGEDGIVVGRFSTNSVFTGNRSRDNADYGIWLSMFAESYTFRGNVLTGNGLAPSNRPLR